MVEVKHTRRVVARGFGVDELRKHVQMHEFAAACAVAKLVQFNLDFAYLPRECHALLRRLAISLDQRPTANDYVHVLGVRHLVTSSAVAPA
jgi:hypothetical protein